MRQRHVWVHRSKQGRVIKDKAENIGYINQYYTLRQLDPPRLVDDAWAQYERKLTSALNELADPTVSSVDGLVWLRTLVPFVAGIFVRGPDFVHKYEGPILDRINPDPVWRSDNTNTSRLIAMVRSLAPIMAAKWTVLHTTGSEPLLTNDLGYVNSSSTDNPSAVGWAIPIGPRCALQLVPCPDGHSRKIMFHTGDHWRAFVEHKQLNTNNHVGLNAAISRMAHEFIVGPTCQSVETHVSYMGQNKEANDTFTPQMLTSHRMQIVHEFEWYRLASALRYSPRADVSDRFALDFEGAEGADDDWSPPIVLLPTNLPEFKTGLRLRGRCIELAMSVVPGFTDGSPPPFPWDEEENLQP